MTPEQMSALHHAAFVGGRGWSAQEITDLLSNQHTDALIRPHGFAIFRSLAGESELLTIAVDPGQQRQGIGRDLMHLWLEQITGRADTAFLEVAADNQAARALYDSLGFCISGTRHGYYARATGGPVDALLMRRDVTPAPARESTPETSESG